jgi:sulfur carrier protein ThiS
LITINLLGGAKKTVGRSTINFDKASSNLQDLLEFLKANSDGSNSLDPHNILVSINGVEYSSISDNKREIKSGDVVTIVNIVHGG